MVKKYAGVLMGIFATLLTAQGWAMMQSIGKDQVNVRSGPSINHSVVFQAPLGYPVEIKKQEGPWVLIQDWEGDSGWVSKPFISRTQTAVVSVVSANVRRSPGVQHAVVKQVHRGEIYKILEKKGCWVKIGYYLEREQVGWIRQDLIFGD